MNIEVENSVQNLIRALNGTTEYNQYHNLLERIKKQPELYERVADFRRRSLWIRTAEDIDRIHEVNNLQNQFKDLQNNGLTNEFMIAESQYCHLVQDIQQKLLEGADIETEFLDG